MSDQNGMNKQQELEGLLAQIEKKVRFQRGMNIALWGVIVAMFGFYAFYIPGLAKEVLSNDTGPRVLTQVARNIAPTPEKIVAKVQTEIPKMIDQGLDAAESYLNKVEGEVLGKFDKNTDAFFEHLSEFVRPMVRQAIHEELPRIRALMQKAKSDEAHKATIELVRESFRNHLARTVAQFERTLDGVETKLAEYESDQGVFTKRHLAERQLLLSLVRLAQEPAVRDSLKSLHDQE